jgi:hypothetical protein
MSLLPQSLRNRVLKTLRKKLSAGAILQLMMCVLKMSDSVIWYRDVRIVLDNLRYYLTTASRLL